MANQSEAICTEVPRAETIARLNDQLRKTGAGGTVMVTQNVRNITGFDPAALAATLATYQDFDPHGDPHGERDFGTMTLWGYDLIWKVDYYDKGVNYGSDDPANPEITHRVLNVLLATDW